jgi:3-hydroxyisobutyrate dehydrogenase
MTKTTIAFIGAGIMGVPMAGHLLAAGHALRVHSRTRTRADGLIAAGATWCDSPAEAAAGASVLITIVKDTPDVEQVLFDAGGAIETLAPDATVIDMSTIAPHAARRAAERLNAAGVAFLDAPVTGGEIGARNATLTIMVGGPHNAFERARPILELMGRKVVHVGPSGAGQALKACNQILCAVNMVGVCEALLLARSAGLDLPTALETLSTGAGGSWAWNVLGGKIVAGDLAPAFMIELMQKDLRIAQASGQAAGVAMPGTALAQQLFRAVEAREGGGRLGTQAMILALEALSKVNVPR